MSPEEKRAVRSLILDARQIILQAAALSSGDTSKQLAELALRLGK